MLNTYHQLNMKFELLEWEIDDNIITFGSLPGTSVSEVNFESVDMYLENRFDTERSYQIIKSTKNFHGKK